MSKSVDEFQTSLDELKAKYTATTTAESSNESNLTPESKRHCMQNLDETIETLIKIKKNLKEAKLGNPVNVVQVIGLERLAKPLTTSQFQKCLDEIACRYSRDARQESDFRVKSLKTEENFNLDNEMKMKRNNEYFIEFESEEQALTAVGIGDMQLSVDNGGGRSGVPIKYVFPTRTSAIRAAYRAIGNLINRLGEVDKQLKALGAIPGSGVEYQDCLNHFYKRKSLMAV